MIYIIYYFALPNHSFLVRVYNVKKKIKTKKIQCNNWLGGNLTAVNGISGNIF